MERSREELDIKATIQKNNRQNNRQKTLSIFALLFVLVANIMMVYFSLVVLSTIQQQQAEAIKSRNVQLTEIRNQNTQLKDYTKCIVLLKYDNPELTAQSTRSDVEEALDKCGSKS